MLNLLVNLEETAESAERRRQRAAKVPTDHPETWETAPSQRDRASPECFSITQLCHRNIYDIGIVYMYAYMYTYMYRYMYTYYVHIYICVCVYTYTNILDILEYIVDRDANGDAHDCT